MSLCTLFTPRCQTLGWTSLHSPSFSFKNQAPVSFIPIKNNNNLTPVIITIWVPFTVLTFEVNREFKQPTFLSDVVQPEVSLFLFNICLGSTKFLLLSVFPFKETIYPKICSKSRLRCAKSSLPVDARHSKTSLPVLLKIMTENGTNSPPMKLISDTILFVYSLRGALSKLRADVTRDRLQNSPYFCVFKYARAVKQKVEAENKERDWACEARAVRARRLLRHALPISLLILRKKPTVLQSTLVMTQIFWWNHHIIVRLPRRYLVAFSYPDYSKLNGNWHTCTNPRPGQYLTHEQSHITRVLADICSYLSRPRGILIRIFCKSCIIFFGSTSCL